MVRQYKKFKSNLPASACLVGGEEGTGVGLGSILLGGRGGLEGAVGDRRPDLVNESAENNSLDVKLLKQALSISEFKHLAAQCEIPPPPISWSSHRVVADVWEDVWEFQAKSGSSGSCRFLLHFLGKIAVQKMSGKTPGSPRHPSSRHPRPSDPKPGCFKPGCLQFFSGCALLRTSAPF